jgi:protein-L-isoaspartate O-methyltransferase
VASKVVGDGGSVVTIEIDAELAARAEENLASDPRVRVIAGDAHAVDLWRGARKVSVGFAVPELPDAWLDALAVGGCLVAPIGTATSQVLTRFEKLSAGTRTATPLGAVRYVADRGATYARSE